MTYLNLLYVFVISLGLIVYLLKPRHLFIYWLSAHAFVVPLYFFLFHPTYSGKETFATFYFGYMSPLSYLLLVIIFLEYLKNKNLHIKQLIIPFLILLSFFVFQNVMTGFNIGPLIANAKDAFFLMLPTLALSVSYRIRPEQRTLVHFIVLFIAIQTVFCIFNLYGVRLYSEYNDESSFADEYICGSFLRYNHLTNYLTTMYLLLSMAFFVYKSLSKYLYIIMSLLLCVIILISGARISVVLFFMVIGLSLLLFRGRHLIMLFFLAIIVVYSASMLSSKYDVGTQNADSGSGLERNVTGLVDLFTSKDNDDNTLSLSGILMLTQFKNPWYGNGYAYRETNEYEITEKIDESTVKTDARMAYMLVEYGIIGCLCFFILFYGIVRFNIVQSGVKNIKMWIIVIVYYVIFTFTETGLFDLMQLSMISILCFSIVNKEGNKNTLIGINANKKTNIGSVER